MRGAMGLKADIVLFRPDHVARRLVPKRFAVGVTGAGRIFGSAVRSPVFGDERFNLTTHIGLAKRS